MEEIKFLRSEINFKNEIIFDKSNNDYDVDKTIKEKTFLSPLFIRRN